MMTTLENLLAHLNGCGSCPKLTEANLRGADLREANLREANLTVANLRGADLRGADLREAKLTGADLRGADLRRADLRGANLRWADLTGAKLTEADLRGANLRGANLRGANLRWVKLTGASLREANLKGANLRWVKLTGADLRGANLRWVKLTGADLRGIEIDDVYLGLPFGMPHVRKVVLSSPNRLMMCNWHENDSWRNGTAKPVHECSTAHCLAGWAHHLNAIERPGLLDEKINVELVGVMALGPEVAKRFYDSDEAVLEWLRSDEWEKSC